MSDQINPSLISQLKRSLGNETMTTEEALNRCLDIAIENRNLKTTLHDALVEEIGVIPLSAQRHVDQTELNYAWIRKMRGAK